MKTKSKAVSYTHLDVYKRQVFVVIVIIMAAVTFFAGKYAYHLLREYIEYASKQSTEVVLEKDGLKGMIEWMSEKEKEKLPKKFLVSDIEAEL